MDDKAKYDLLLELDIHNSFYKYLEHLSYKFKVIVLCDDSTSMRNHMVKQPNVTKWNYMKEQIVQIVKIFKVFNIRFDLKLMNKEITHCNADSVSDIMAEFNEPPRRDDRHLVACLSELFENSKDELKHNSLLFIIFTDGDPECRRCSSKEKLTKEFKKCLENRKTYEKKTNNRICVNIVTCTDNNEDIKFLNKLDTKLENIDVTSEFNSEQEQINSTNRLGRTFGYGDYLIKMICGSVFSEIDSWDEKKTCEVS